MTVPATTFAVDNPVATVKDEALIAAWRRFKIARATYSALPHDEPCAEGETDSPAALEQIAIFEAAEQEIIATVPETDRGIEIKLWLALATNIDQSEIDILCAIREDERHFREDEHGLDWTDKIVFSAIQGLRELQAAEKGGAA